MPRHYAASPDVDRVHSAGLNPATLPSTSTIHRPTLDTAPTNMIDHQQLAAVLSIQINDRQSLLQPSRLLHAVEHQLSRIGLMGTAIIACQHQSAGENDSVNSIPTSKRPRRHFTQQAYDQNLRTAVETMTVFFHFQQVSVNITYGDDDCCVCSNKYRSTQKSSKSSRRLITGTSFLPQTFDLPAVGSYGR